VGGIFEVAEGNERRDGRSREGAFSIAVNARSVRSEISPTRETIKAVEKGVGSAPPGG